MSGEATIEKGAVTNDLAQLSVQILHAVHPLSRYLFIAAMALFLLDLARSRHDQKIEPKSQGSASYRSVAAFVLTFVLCLLVLATSWTGGGTQDYSAIGGLLPHSDASDYYGGAEHLLHDGSLTDWSERRPLNAAFFAARLLLTGDNFYLAMVIQAIIVAVAVFAATNAVWRLQGLSASLVFFAINFAFINGCLFRTLSEPLGISLGLISFALYWAAIAERSLFYYGWATFFLTLALLARAGAMFELLGSIAFAPFLFSDHRRGAAKATFTATAAVAGGWLLNKVLVQMFGTGAPILSNFSYTLYGLARGGKNWTQAVLDFPELKGSDSQVSVLIFWKAIESIVHDPLLLVAGLAKGLFKSLAIFPPQLLQLLADATDGAPPWSASRIWFPALLLVPPFLYGTFCLTTSRRKSLERFHNFLLFHLTSFAASLPFFYPDGGIRLVAATFPILAAAVVLILQGCQPRVMTLGVIPKALNTVVIALGLAIAALSLVSPILGWRVLREPLVSAVKCPAGSERFAGFIGHGATYINVVETDEPNILPNIRRKDFRVSQWNEARKFWDSSPGSVTWLLAYDFDDRTLKLISGPVGFASGPRRAKLLCVAPSENGTYSLRQIIDLNSN